MTGQLVRALIDDEKNAGWHETVWNGRDENGRLVAANIYLYRLTVTSPAMRGNVVFAKTRKMTMLR
jgi:flagellar hook assembly protein FlgD